MSLTRLYMQVIKIKKFMEINSNLGMKVVKKDSVISVNKAFFSNYQIAYINPLL